MLIRLVLLAALFGLLFGYDEGSISGALSLISQSFAITAFFEGMIAASVPLGAVAGVIFAAIYADKLGRRKVLYICSFLFLAGAVASGLSPDQWVLSAARLVLGFSIGASAMAAPMYLAELAPAENRGVVVFAFQLLITVGIMVAYLADAALQPLGAWRWMLALGAVPALITLLGLRSAPESPRWLARNGDVEQARKIIAESQPRLNGYQVEAILTDIEKAKKDHAEDVTLRMFFQPKYRYVTIFAILSFVLPALVGINAIIYYAPIILGDSGFTTANSALVATVGVGAVNVGMTLVSMYLIDRIGRRPLFIIGFAGTSVAMGIVVLALTMGGASEGWLLLVGLFLFIAAFAVSLGPLPWLYMAELFPFSFRSKGMAMASAGNWFFNFIVVFLFPDLLTILGPPATFSIFLGFCLFGLIYALIWAPETKGISLEEISRKYTGRHHHKQAEESAGD
ncbi:MAG: sugar porter family MFS transporter [Pseudomonadota bacterium]